MFVLGAFVVIYALMSTLWAPGDSAWALVELTSLCVAFAIGWMTSSKLWLWFLIVVAIATVAYALAPIINPDYVACAIALALPIAVVYEFWLYVPLPIFGLWFTGDRTAIIAASVGTFVALFRRFPMISLCGLLLTIPIVGEIKLKMASSFFQRVGIWQDTLNHTSFFGHGFGSFAETYATWSPHTNVTFALPIHAYSDGLELISDLGIATIPLWIFIALCLRNADQIQRAVFLTFAVLGLAYFPLWVPPCAQLAACALGQASRRGK